MPSANHGVSIDEVTNLATVDSYESDEQRRTIEQEQQDAIREHNYQERATEYQMQWHQRLTHLSHMH